MSRIDEALKRAAAANATTRGVGAVVRTPHTRDDQSLSAYPAERLSPDDVQLAVPARQQRSRVTHPQSTIKRAVPGQSVGPIDGPFEGKLVVSTSTPSVSVEQYRRLAATMHELQLERELKILMITSAVPREGKTLTVTNLALTLSGSYERRVLLIDADLRRPSVHEVLNLPNTAGLHEALEGRSEFPFRQVTPFLTVLTAGKPESNPMALLTSERMRQLLDESSEQFDWVLLDAPPVGFMPDAGLLASMAQGVLFVIAAGSTPYHLVQRATTELGLDCIVGTVLNRVDDQNIPATGYYHDYYGTPSEG